MDFSETFPESTESVAAYGAAPEKIPRCAAPKRVSLDPKHSVVVACFRNPSAGWRGWYAPGPGTFFVAVLATALAGKRSEVELNGFALTCGFGFASHEFSERGAYCHGGGMGSFLLVSTFVGADLENRCTPEAKTEEGPSSLSSLGA